MADAPECPDTARPAWWVTAAPYVVGLGACFFPVAMAAVIGVVLVLAGVR